MYSSYGQSWEETFIRLSLIVFILCIGSLILGNIDIVRKPPMYKYKMYANYWLIFLALLSGFATWYVYSLWI